MSSESSAILQKNRNFICSCGKAYLSYAALFTHIKQKHGGKAPGEIIRPRSQNKRGRPRKTQKLGSDKTIKSLSHIDFLDNNNLKNNNFTNQLNLDDNLLRLSQPFSAGFRSYQDQRQQYKSRSHPHLYEKNIYRHSSLKQSLQMNDDHEQESNIQLSHLNNQFSTNTIRLAQVIIYLQQLFKNANKLQQVHNEDLQRFSSFQDLRQYHSQKLNQGKTQISDQKVFLLGNVVCGFLNFCQQTIQSKAGYQQIVLLMVCLLDHIKSRKKFSILRQCLKDVINETLHSFFTQYLDKVIIKYKLNFWIFKQNNSFKVISWFLNWISTIESNLAKQINQQKNQKQEIYFEQKQIIPLLEKTKSVTQNQQDKKQTVCTELNNTQKKQDQDQIKSKSQNQIQCQFQQFVQQFGEVIDNIPLDQKCDQNQPIQDAEDNESVQNQSQNRPLLEA